jgi:hypothetical protein
MTDKLPPIHRGEILREDFMLPLGLSSNALARAIGVTPARINEIIVCRPIAAPDAGAHPLVASESSPAAPHPGARIAPTCDSEGRQRV